MSSNGTGTALALPHQPARTGQATAIEQSRAAAEVYASVLAAKQCPRDEQYAIRSMQQACQMPELAERAFFRFPRAGQQVSGPSVHLARELARCWGNVDYGVSELRRDDEAYESEMKAYAWDLETNSRSSAIFIVKHLRDKRGGAERLTDMRDIYEQNANNGARRVREAIFAVLPLWFVEQAQTLCRQTLESGGGKPLPQRIADAIARFAAIGVREEQLADKIGQASGKWTAEDLAQLTVTYTSIKRGEVTKDEEFPPRQRVVTADELASGAQPTAGTPKGDQPAAITQRQSKRIHAMLTEGGISSRETKLDLFSYLTGRSVESSKDLTQVEADTVIAKLDGYAERGPLAEVIAEELDRASEEAAPQEPGQEPQS
jgi:hypothetical protein